MVLSFVLFTLVSLAHASTKNAQIEFKIDLKCPHIEVYCVFPKDPPAKRLLLTVAARPVSRLRVGLWPASLFLWFFWILQQRVFLGN